MSIFTKKGLLLDNNLSDINNKEAAVNNMLANFAGGNRDAFSLADLQPLRGISTTSFNPEQAFVRMAASPSFTDLGDGSTFSTQTYKNKIDDIELYTGKPSYHGGNGLTGRFYRIEDLPTSLQNQLIGSPLNPSDLLRLDNSPNDITFDELAGVNPSRKDDNLWIDGDIDFPKVNSFLEQTAGVRVALFTGFFHAANVHQAATGDEAIDGILFNHNDFTLEANAEEFTNVIVRVLIRDNATDATLLDATYDPISGDSPEQSGAQPVVRLINGGSFKDGAGNTADKMLKRYQLCKISIAFILTDDIINVFSGQTSKVRMKFVTASKNGIHGEHISMTRNYFYNEDYNPGLDSPPELPDGTVRTAEKKALKKYGSLLNLYSSEPSSDSPPSRVAEDVDASQQIGTPDTFNELVIDSPLRLTYEPKSGGYSSIKIGDGSSPPLLRAAYEFTSGNDFIRMSGDDLSNIQKGNFVQGLVSLATPDSKKSAIYVVGVSARRGIVYLSEPATLDDSDLNSPTDSINFIEHRGLIGFGTLDATGSAPNLRFTQRGLHGQRDLKAGDFVYIENDTATGMSYNATHYFRVKYTSPLTLEAIESNGNRTEITQMSTGSANAVTMYYYAPNALDNQVLDKFCTLDDSPPHKIPLVRLEVKTEVSSGSTIVVNKNAVTFQGASVDLALQNSPTESDDDIVGRFVVFDGDGVNSVIPADAKITKVETTSDSATITIDKTIGGRLAIGSFLTVARTHATADVKYKCFPPTDPTAPFKSEGETVSTIPSLNRDVVDFVTGQNGSNVTLEFDGLKLINDDSPSPTAGLISAHAPATAPYTHKLKILGMEDFDGSTREVEYFIPISDS